MIHTVVAVVDVAVAKVVSVNATRRNKVKISKKQLKRIIKEELTREGRYQRAPYKGKDPRAQALDQAISLLNDLTYDSLEDDVASYTDDAVRAMSKAIEELEYQRNQVGNEGGAK